MNQQILVQTHNAIVLHRARESALHHALLISCFESAERVAARFSEAEAWVLHDAYARLTRDELAEIDPMAANTESSDDDHQGAFSQVFAAKLNCLLLVRSDVRFQNPWDNQEGGLTKAIGLAEKVRVLSADEAVALHVILECARAVSPAIFFHATWWSPRSMLNLLETPATDWPI